MKMVDESKVTYLEGEVEIREDPENKDSKVVGSKPNIRTLRGVVSGADDTGVDFITVERNDGNVQINKSSVIKIEQDRRMQE